MEVVLHLQIPDKSQSAGSSIEGELSISTQAPQSSVQIDIFLSSQESVNFRSLDSNTHHCSDKSFKTKKSYSALSFPFETLDAGTSTLNFKLSLPPTLPPSCLIDSNSDIGKISYKLKSVFKSESCSKASCSVPIQITPQTTGASVLDHVVGLRGCCLSYGSVQITSVYPVQSWRLSDSIDFSLDFNNSNCSVPITQISYELWKKVHLRDNNKNTESSSTLITRGHEKLALRPREALLASGHVPVKICLDQVQNRTQGHVSTVSEHISVEYSLKFTVFGKTCCGLVQGSFIRALMIHS